MTFPGKRTTLGASAALIGLFAVGGAILILTRERDEARPPARNAALDNACATAASRLITPVPEGRLSPDDASRVASRAAAEVGTLRRPRPSGARELAAALRDYAGTQLAVGSGDALIDPVALAAGADKARRRLDRVAAAAQAPSCASAVLAGGEPR